MSESHLLGNFDTYVYGIKECNYCTNISYEDGDKVYDFNQAILICQKCGISLCEDCIVIRYTETDECDYREIDYILCIDCDQKL